MEHEGALVYSLIKDFGLRTSLEKEFLPFIIALFIANTWFKWGSFLYELIGFIATWIVLGFIFNSVRNMIRR